MPGVINLAAVIVASAFPSVGLATAAYALTVGALYGGLAFGSLALQKALAPKPEVPRPEDGSFNLKQNVPHLAYVLGKVKKGGDYAFLEEANGIAYHVIVWAGHRIKGYTQHYLHDAPVTLDGSGNVVAPDNFDSYVNIKSRVGLNAETAYVDLISVGAFAGIWTADHRGDGLASVMMWCRTAPQEEYLTIYPNQMPQHSAIGEGALLYDPRKDSTQGGAGSHRFDDPNTWEYSSNLALMRLWHICHPVGGKQTYDRMHMPDWQRAADVADQNVTNRSGGIEKRYHGGLWFRSNSDPVEVGRILDEAGEMVVYERADGTIGVHAGEFVAPTVRLTENEIFSISVDKNRRQSSTVLAVRGRYVNTANHYNTEDAALYGDPYGEIDEDTERTRTFDNPAVQSHNHCQRKQKLSYIRANARKVQIVADYSAGKGARYSRFVTVHFPRRGLVEAVVEITSTVSIDLRNMRVSFSGIIVTADLFAFNSAIEEGAPGSAIPAYTPAGPPEPTGVNFTVQTEVVAGGSTAAFILATWAHVNDTLLYEVEYERTSGSTGAQSVYSKNGEDQVRTGYLADGAEYRVRIRSVGGGTFSDWSDYTNLTATADPVAPGPVTGVSVSPGSEEAQFDWVSPNSGNYFACRIYLNTVDNFGTATLAATEYGAPNTADSRVLTGLTPDTYFAWLVAINASGVPAAEVATGSFTV